MITDEIVFTINCVSLVFSSIVVYGTIFEQKHQTSKVRTFLWFAILLVIGLLFDTLSYLPENWIIETKYLMAFTVISFFMDKVITYAFCRYTLEFIAERCHVSDFWHKLFSALFIIALFVDIYFLATDGFFIYADGIYQEGPYIDLSSYMSMIMLSGVLAITARFKHVISHHDIIALLSYVALPVFGCLLYINYEDFSIVYSLMSVSMFIIYVMMMRDMQTAAEIREQLLLEASQTDMLTGILNRRALEEDLLLLPSSPHCQQTIFISIDLNYLKFANDNYGHNAGDELLIGIAQCLTAAFGDYGRIYRQGGDEFIVILTSFNGTNDELKHIMQEKTASWSGRFSQNLSFSLGIVRADEYPDLSPKALLSIADARMYESKEAHHRTKHTL